MRFTPPNSTKAIQAATMRPNTNACSKPVTALNCAQAWFTWPLQWPLSFLFSERYAAERAAVRLAPVPLLVVHGADDDVVPVSHARRLFEAALRHVQPGETVWMIGDNPDADCRPVCELGMNAVLVRGAGGGLFEREAVGLMEALDLFCST